MHSLVIVMVGLVVIAAGVGVVARARVRAPQSPRASPAPLAPGHRSLEEVIGTRWITWLGAIALLAAAGFFVQLAVQRGWLGPTGRIGLALGFGVALIVTGERALANAMRPLGQGLVGAGLGVLYLALYAGLSAYHLYPPALAFAMLVAVTVGGTALALRHDAHPIALLAVLGGLATPVLVSTGADHRDALCAYLAILDAGVLAIAFARTWYALDLLALVGTWALVAASGAALPWLGVFFAIFAATPFTYHLRRRVPMRIDRFLAAIGNALVAFGLAAHVVHDRHVLGDVALALAAAHLVLGAMARRRLADDVRAVFGFLVLAAGFATLAIALHLDGDARAIGWALEAPVLLGLGAVYAYRPARLGAAGALGFALIQVLIRFPFHHGGFVAAMIVPAVAAVCALLYHRTDDRDLARPIGLAAVFVAAIFAHARTGGELAPMAIWTIAALVLAVRRERLAAAAALGAAALLVPLAYAHPMVVLPLGNLRFAAVACAIAASLVVARGRERFASLAAAWLALSTDLLVDAAHPQLALSVAWSLCAIALCAAGFRWRSRILRIAGLALFALTAGKLVLIDLAALDQASRVLSFLAAGLLMMAASWLYHRAERRYSAGGGSDTAATGSGSAPPR